MRQKCRAPYLQITLRVQHRRATINPALRIEKTGPPVQKERRARMVTSSSCVSAKGEAGYNGDLTYESRENGKHSVE